MAAALPAVVADGSDLDACAEAQYGAWLCGADRPGGCRSAGPRPRRGVPGRRTTRVGAAFRAAVAGVHLLCGRPEPDAGRRHEGGQGGVPHAGARAPPDGGFPGGGVAVGA